MPCLPFVDKSFTHKKIGMEGVLLKWTNYVSGWQPRWFVLESDGTLSYFNSRDDTKNGVRGSVNLALCEIIVHQYNHKQLDIVIPGEQHYSLRANTSEERSVWLRKLGSTKLVSKRRRNEADVTEAIKTKRSEVRLYMDLILQQASEAQSSLQSDNNSAAQHSLAMLATTAQILARTVDDCLLLSASITPFTGPSEAHLVLSPSVTPHPNNAPDSLSISDSNIVERVDPVSSPVSYFNSHLGLVHHRGSVGSPATPGSVSMDKLIIEDSCEITVTKTPVPNGDHEESPKSRRNMPLGELACHKTPSIDENAPIETPVISDHEANLNKNEQAEHQFLSSLVDFKGRLFSDVYRLENKDDMTVSSFIIAAGSIVEILERFNTSVLTPVRGDVAGNIAKIDTSLKNYAKKGQANLETCSIQNLIMLEIAAGKSTTDPSASVGLVWLTRGLSFVAQFLVSLADPACEDARQAASAAYQNTLRKFHGMMARAVFSVALQALASRPSQFLLSIGGENCNLDDIRKDIKYYVSGLEEVLDSLKPFLDSTGLSKKL